MASLLALVFVACGDKDSGDPGDPGTPAPQPSTPAVTAAILEYFPTVPYLKDQWGAFEGTPVNMANTRVRIQYADGTRRVVTYEENPGRFSIWPPIYMVRETPSRDVYNVPDGIPGIGDKFPITYGGVDRTPGVDTYELTFVYGSFAAKFQINNGMMPGLDQDGAIGYVEPVINVFHIGQLNQQDFYVDEQVKFAGIRLFGEYSADATVTNTVGPTNPDWHQVELTSYLPLYMWRWVWNNDNVPADEIQWGGSDDGWFPDQQPGVMIQVGTYGDLWGSNPLLGAWSLTGRRVPVRNLWQVASISFEPAQPNWPVMYFDDPTLFGIALDGFRIENWTKDVLKDVGLRVQYRGPPGTSPASKLIPLTDFGNLSMDPWVMMYGNVSSLWYAPQLRFFVDRNQRNDAAQIIGTTSADGSVLTEADARTRWHNWVRNSDTGQAIVATYRGASTDRLLVPFYNSLSELDVSTTLNPLIMYGAPLVDNRMDMEPEFLGRVKVTAYYLHNQTQTACPGRDILSAISLNRSRSEVFTNVEDRSLLPGLRKINLAIFNQANSRSYQNNGDLRPVTVTMNAHGPNGGPRDPSLGGSGMRVGRATDTLDVGQLNYPPR